MILAIIIPTFNRKEYLRILLNQLQVQKRLVGLTIEIVVVVDGSSDGTLEMLLQEFANVHIVQGNGNWWYTKCMNEGFKFAGRFTPDFIITLNDDIEVKQNYIKNLYSAYSLIEKDSIVGSLSVSIEKPHRVTNSGNSFRSKTLGTLKHHLKLNSNIDLNSISGLKGTEILPGRGLFIPYHTLCKLNYFDEKFVQYHSDTDFCLRAKENGIKVFISWDSVIFSHVNLTSSSSSYKKQNFYELINSFFNKYSRNYLKTRISLIYRHQTKLFMPFILILNIIIIFKNHFLKSKIDY